MIFLKVFVFEEVFLTFCQLLNRRSYSNCAFYIITHFQIVTSHFLFFYCVLFTFLNSFAFVNHIQCLTKTNQNYFFKTLTSDLFIRIEAKKPSSSMCKHKKLPFAVSLILPRNPIKSPLIISTSSPKT